MISLCITSFNRSDLTIESFSKVYNHPLISEIVIVDDASLENHWQDLRALVHQHPVWDKIRLFRNKENLGMSRNKAHAVNKATNKWVILFDSDNILYPEYMDAINNLVKLNCLNASIISHPIFAEPDYDFSLIGEDYIDEKNAKDFLHIKEFRIFLNCCNFLVNRNEYLKVYRYNPDIKESDSIWFNYLWLRAGNMFSFEKGMRYYHRRHEGSGWLNGDHSYNLKKAEEIQEKIKYL